MGRFYSLIVHKTTIIFFAQIDIFFPEPHGKEIETHTRTREKKTVGTHLNLHADTYISRCSSAIVVQNRCFHSNHDYHHHQQQHHRPHHHQHQHKKTHTHIIPMQLDYCRFESSVFQSKRLHGKTPTPTHVLPTVRRFRRRHNHRRSLLCVPHPRIEPSESRRRCGSSSDRFDALQSFSGRRKVSPYGVKLEGVT